ncbi:P-type conjugative transfer protein TrbJ [Pseudaquidulcibacter saccharophilus]|uniref:P-type conjugative transfer protein TrbJ n=1 Tax=Pseudaquidulcibacter saccharophilus TaxID=2831900 RepID=UPI001EFF3D25|nr:P-type conjugative transfer protein TrbJ [Pseudaquidulcibacter saccharophilus]
MKSTNLSKRSFLTLSVISLFAFTSTIIPKSANALVVYDPTAVAKLIEQLNRQLQQLKIAQQQLNDMVVNSATLPAQYWGQTMQNINRVNQLMNDVKSLSYQGNNIEQQIRQRYQGYSTYSGSGINSITGKYNQWSDETNSSIQATLAALGMQNSQMNDEDALMRQLEAMGNSAQGRMQAAQVGNQMAAQGVRQTQKLRQLMMLQTQMQANWYASQQDQADVKAAASGRLHKSRNFKITGGKRY